ncbi:GMC family oxidoreductase N-terminal domain-containing protein [Aquiflexum gelatinilyticum]|uniref:GMC family oxidoreductase N-terminal domain-containing protein n=1 Tax=Aquiflexum gelatinilyticum TaxID=2961943 RepID=UPI002168A580|nr:GMC family oxidoreductase [Aquiflexum gelatinilyticum]MCS4436917.1 GMC family oxidoreductase [Aquiflexum gelatinilyticum]
MKKLSKPLSDLKSHYDFIVIGSGYGGSIAASRMSRLGKSVCLFEKGKEFLPGQFPDSLAEATKEMTLNVGKEHKEKNGLYEFTIGEGISVLKGCGLGGTSLINANVSIKPDPRVMDQPEWPSAIRDNLPTFYEGLDKAWEMLKPNPYPENKNGYPVLNKTQGMRKSAERMAEEFRLLDINVTFENKNDNHVGISQPKCTNCGDCVTGCNVGAKNTTAMNYLPDAFNHGAEIFTEINVRHIEKTENGWRVFFNPMSTGREVFDAPEMFIEAENVILGAGSLGSTEILLRSAKKGLSISDFIGKRFTGNGDVLGFGYNNDVAINGIGLGKKATDKIANVGPCITSVIDMRNRPKMEDGMTLEEGSVPGPIRGLMAGMLVTTSRLFGKNTDRGWGDFFKEKIREITSLIRGPFYGAVNHTQIYLVMTHDDGNGEMALEKDNLRIKWKGVGKQEIFKKVSGELYSATEALGGSQIPNPTWNKMMDYDLVTVHPLGGCNMGDDATKGVVDHKGQVFSGKSGTALHKGLYVMDGAVIPRPVGTNPLLTISALAERSCKIIAEELETKVNYSWKLIPEKDSFPNLKPGVQFTESMKGYFSLEETDDYEKGFDKGKAANSPFEFTLTIKSEDVDSFVEVATHEAGMFGTMLAPALSKFPFTAVNGTFNLFIEHSQDPNRKKMIYNTLLLSQEGNKYYFMGFKEVFNDKGFDVWKDTTTLFITLHEGDSSSGKVIGKGKLIIEPTDFAKQLTTMKALNTTNKMEELKAIGTFGKFFAGNVFETYFKKLGK